MTEKIELRTTDAPYIINDDKERPIHVEDNKADGNGYTDTLKENGEDEDEDDFKFTFGKFMAMMAFSLGYVSDQFVVTFVGATLATVNRDIGPSASYVWMSLGQTAGTAALAPVAGRLGDIFGRRNFIIAGNMISVIGTCVAATAKDINTVIAGAVLIGIAGSFRQIAWTSLGELVPKAYRGMAFGCLSTVLAITTAFGGIIAFAFIANGSWRPIYWFPMALDAASLILTFFFYHPVNQYIHEVGTSTWAQILETDFVGCFVFIAGLVLFLLGLSFGGSRYPWVSAGTLAPLIVGIVTLIACGFYESFINLKWPIFPPSIFRNIRGFTLVQAGVFLYGMSFYATAVLWPTQVQVLYTQSPYPVGWYSGATGFGGLVFSPLIGYLILKLRHVRYQLIFYVFGVLITSGCQAIVTPQSHVASTALVVLLFACVAGVNITTLTFVQVTVKHEFIGIATGITICSRSVGGSVGQVIYTTILQNQLTSNLAADVSVPLARAGVALSSIPAVLEALLTGETTSRAVASLTPSQLMIAAEGIATAYAGAFRTVYLVTIAFGVIGLITVCFVADIDHLLTQKVDIRLEEGAKITAHMDTGKGHIIQQNERSA
ncbi:trichothecene efflux pump [Lepidopterella palustris CBS 459.81]|uniref:Trichothecene efflux pump n=1 Tax=Lepidopterella palustris CBS 459.81 TaxID=1314670 RepID=A0A8E2J9T8_9PEZI|nr:trichothecene efflux pump [Lepidopterella palustris CBS 459.81]